VAVAAYAGPHGRPDMGAAALRYAERGWAVLPVAGMVDGRCGCARPCDRPAKHPLTHHGLLDATTDAATIRGWWARHPGANIGVATGASGLVVIDVDMPDGGRSLERLDALGLHRAPTLVGLTGGGGRHLVYAAGGGGVPGLHNTARGLPGVGEALPDIDLRAQGGYIVAPPSMHASGARYRWEDPARAVAPAPGWLQAVTVPVAHPGPRPALGPLPTTGGTRYGLVALEGELTTLGAAGGGTRNHQLNRSAFALGRLCAGGQLDAGLAVGELTRVATGIGLGAQETAATVASGMDAGQRYPPVPSPSAPPQPTRRRQLLERDSGASSGAALGRASPAAAPAPAAPVHLTAAPARPGAEGRHEPRTHTLGAEAEQPPVIQP